MAFSLPLPHPLPGRGWKAKIRDWERSEPPHVTIIRKRQSWRFGLRSRTFLDKEPNPNDVPREIVVEIDRQWESLRAAWDDMYPENPVESEEDDDD